MFGFDDTGRSSKRYVTTRDMALIALFALLIAVGTFIRVPLPFSPLPVTLQTAVVLFSGLLLGARRAAAAALLYLCMGLFGLPVFTGGGGLHSVLQPSFGFIVGFVPAAWVVGRLGAFAAKPALPRFFPAATLLRRIFACLAGIFVYDAVGVAWLYCNLNLLTGQAFSLQKTLAIGLFPFLLPDLIKLLAVVPLAEALAARLRAFQPATVGRPPKP